MKSALNLFLENNKGVKISENGKNFILSNCWEDDSFFFIFKSKESMSFLDNMIFPKELFGIYHKDKKLYEFIYAPLPEKYERSFEYIFKGKEFRLYYGAPSKEFEKLAKHVSFSKIPESQGRYFGLARYHLYYQDKDASLKPTNFFIEGDFDDDINNHIIFFKHVNFIMKYYDRESPIIYIQDSNESDIGDIKIPCKKDVQSFPKKINTKQLDTTLLELIEAARESTNLRLKYIFYFQVLEYCSYYYIENNLKRQITNIIKSPDILNSDIYSNKIIEIYSDYFKQYKDDKRMERLINDLCSYDDIKNEIQANSKYFIDDICFDGGLKIKGIFNSANEIDNPPKEILTNIRKNIDTIRNVLVHARESRENVVISPTHKNNDLLRPYLYLLQRIAEVVVIKYE
jgi:hypothetical protein